MPKSSNGVAWRNRIVGYADVPPQTLIANPRNWRQHPDPQANALAGVLSEVGWVQGVLVNRTSGHVVDGHLRVALAVVYSDTPGDQPGEGGAEPTAALHTETAGLGLAPRLADG